MTLDSSAFWKVILGASGTRRTRPRTGVGRVSGRLVRRGSDGSKWLALSDSLYFGRLGRMFFIFFAEAEFNATTVLRGRGTRAQGGFRIEQK